MTSPQGSRKLPARRRIKESREFNRIKLNGKRFGFGCLVLNWITGNHPATPRLGVIVSRKVGNAVVRNRTKRRLREVFRKHQHALPSDLQLVLVARPSIAGKLFDAVETDFLEAAKRTRLIG